MTYRPGFLLAILLVLVGPTMGAEISSNGLGGGPWSDPATWRGKVPTSTDEVVIQKNDVVLFDRGDGGKPSCRKLLIDPRGGFAFKTGTGKVTFTVDEGIESFGVIRLDGTKSAKDDFEIRLVGDKPDKRVIKLNKGAALLLYGKPDLPGEKKNVGVYSPRNGKEEVLAKIDTEGFVLIDCQRAYFHDVKLIARKLDNTGAKANERIKLVNNRFDGVSRLFCQFCDTPEIVQNTFTSEVPRPLEEPAIALSYCPLSEVKNNIIVGPYPIGINIGYQGDSVLVGNVIEKCTVGIQGGYGLPNSMLKGNTLRGCPTGIKIEGASGAIEDTRIDGAMTSLLVQNSNLQVTHLVVTNLDKKGNAILHESGKLSVLNANVAAEQVKVFPQKPEAGKPAHSPLENWQYVILAVKDVPAGSMVEIRTSTAPAAAADPNVRNSPAALIEGKTPLPKTLTCLMVKRDSFDLNGKLVPAPEYLIRILGPASKEGAERPVLKTLLFRVPASGFRMDPNDPAPTLEVSAK